jgi:hypothetical protein
VEAKHIFFSLHASLYQALIDILADLTDTQLEYCAHQIDARSIRDVALHAYRPLLAVACVLTGDGWPDRPELPTTKDDLLQLLYTMKGHIDACISRITPELLEQSISLPWKQQQQGLDALIEGCTHGFFHVGTIQGIRAFGGFSTPEEDPKPPRGSKQN